MKTLNTSIQPNLNIQTGASRGNVSDILASMRSIMALISAGLTAIAIITLSVWVAGMEINLYFGAIGWGLGFAFFGLAMDSHGRLAMLQSITGASLLVLAMLQNSVSPDFIIGTGTVLATWVAAVSYRLLSV